MEFSGYVVLGSTEFDDYEGTARNRLVRITAHEVSHQWWYNVVGDNQIEEPWLDEGFARFNELRFYEVFSPQDVDWWWSTVIGTQRPAKPLNSPVTAFSENGSYLNSVYNQGARFLDALRQRIGRIAFDAFLRRWYQRGSFQLITTQDFFDTLKPYTTPAVLSLKRLYFR
jgi:aminopeptidase N